MLILGILCIILGFLNLIKMVIVNYIVDMMLVKIKQNALEKGLPEAAYDYGKSWLLSFITLGGQKLTFVFFVLGIFFLTLRFYPFILSYF